MLSKTLAIAGSAIAAAALVGCSSGASSSSELDPLCAQEDLGSEYIELTRGEFTPRDLADLGDDASATEQKFRAAGMVEGRFVFFKQSLPKPPFDPPVNVVCEVLGFGSEEEAQAWVKGLTLDDAATTVAFGWFGEERRTVREGPVGIGAGVIGDPRDFIVIAGDDGDPTVVFLVVGTKGTVVRVIAVGSHGPPGPPVALARELWDGQ